jgi:hypothetical protein
MEYVRRVFRATGPALGGRDSREADDPGLRIVKHVYQRMRIDPQWSQWSERGFTWWGHHHAQRVWADHAVEDLGYRLFRVIAETDYIRLDDGAVGIALAEDM